MRRVFFSSIAIGICIVFGNAVAFCQALSPAEMLKVAKSEAAVNNLPSAFKIAKEAITSDSEHVDARLFLGELYLLTGKPDSARVQYNRILKNNPSNPRALVENYELEFRNRNFGFALHFAEEGLKYYPGSADFTQKKMVALKALGLLKGSEGANSSGQPRPIVTEFPPSPDRPSEPQKAITSVEASPRQRSATEARQGVNPIASNSELAEATHRRTSPGAPAETTQTVKNASADELYELARTEVFERNNYLVGIEYIKKAIGQTPDDARLRTFLGRIYTWSDQLDNARTQFNRVLSVRPSYTDALSASFDLEYWAGNHWLALVIAENALKIHPTSEEFTVKKAQALNSLIKPAEALKVLNKFLLRNPNSPTASNLKTSIETGTTSSPILH